jgi:hypothetical protein
MNTKQQNITPDGHTTKRQLFLTIGIICFLLIGTTLMVLYGRGYRFGFENGKPDLSKTGILAAKSTPDGAQVYIDDELRAATNENINLSPGTYKIRIQKDGYFPWQKTIRIQEEVVTLATARLFPIAPELDSITTIGVLNPVLDPTKTKIAYQVASQSASKKNGIYVFDMSSNPVLALQGASRQIADDTRDILSGANILWAPDGQFLIASTSSLVGLPTSYQLRSQSFNENPQDVSAVLQNIELEWDEEKTQKERALNNRLRRQARTLIADNFTIIEWAADNTKILYQAKRSAELPLIIKPRLIGINNLTEERRIQKDAVYVYDIKEDTNFKILDALPDDCNLFVSCPSLPVQWFPDSNHIIHVANSRIDIVQYDGTNRTTVYAGPFISTHVFPWPDSSRIVILTNLNNPSILPNLYTISLK